MYAIKSGTKFIRAKFFLDPNEVFDFSVSDEAKTYKTLAEAQRVAGLVWAKLDRSRDFYERNIRDESLKAEKAQKDIRKLTERLEDLYNQPFKAVERKVEQTRKQIERAEWYVKSNSVKSWSRDLARVERIRAQGIDVVKIQQTVAVA